MVMPRTRWAAMSGVLSVALAFGCFYQPVVVLGHSMEPALQNRQVVWMDRQASRRNGIHKGDVVVFRLEGVTYVKRVLGAPGDVVGIARFQNGECWLLDDLENSAFGARMVRRLRGQRIVKDYRVPDGHLYVVGDNRNVSMDSRDFGPVPVESVDGIIPSAGLEAGDA